MRSHDIASKFIPIVKLVRLKSVIQFVGLPIGEIYIQ